MAEEQPKLPEYESGDEIDQELKEMNKKQESEEAMDTQEVPRPRTPDPSRPPSPEIPRVTTHDKIKKSKQRKAFNNRFQQYQYMPFPSVVIQPPPPGPFNMFPPPRFGQCILCFKQGLGIQRHPRHRCPVLKIYSGPSGQKLCFVCKRDGHKAHECPERVKSQK